MKKIPYKTHDDWLELRKSGLGGSDAYQIILNKYGSPFSVWLDKTNRGASETKETVPMLHGTLVESAIRDWFIQQTGFEIEKPSYIVRSEEHPFMFASLDGLGTDKDGEQFILEVKDTWDYNNETMLTNGEIPKHWLIQLHHYFAVTGVKYAYLAYWFGNRIMEWIKVERDEELIELIVKTETEFWGKVTDDIEPVITFADEATTKYIQQQKYGELIDETIDNPTIITDMEKHYDLGQQISALKLERDMIKLKLQNIQGNYRKMTSGLFIASNGRRVKTKAVFNEKKFKAENPDLYLEYCEDKEKTTGSYSVKPIKGVE